MTTASLLQLALASAQSIDAAPLWEVTKGVMLTASTALLTWIATTLRKVEREQVNQRHILVGVDGDNGIRSQVRLHEERLGAIEDRNLALDAVADAERHNHPGPDRRIGARRTRDVVHEALDERLRRITDEHSTEEPGR